MRSLQKSGASLAELVVVVLVVGLLMVIAVPRLARARARMQVVAARRAFTAAHSLARLAAAQYGGLSRLHLDPETDRFWVTADTGSLSGIAVRDTLHPVVRVGRQFAGVTIEGSPRTFCFDPRGLATARGDCDLPNATLVFRRGGITDTVTISRLGRVLPR
jgi:type II secretory pathway pseudopilin PulG